MIIKDHCKSISKILVVEDSTPLASFIQSEILKQTDLECDIAFDETQAKSLIEKNSYQFVIVDLYLPNSNNNFVGWLLRKDFSILIMTAKCQNEDRHTLTRLPIVDYVCKADKVTLIRYIMSTIARLIFNENSLVIVCDDSKVARRQICEMLKTQNLPYVVFEDAKSTLDFIQNFSEDITLLISDFEMPQMDGLELTRQLRLENSKLDLPILMLSGNSKGDTIANILKMGANDYVVKPFEHEELMSRINNLIDHRRLYKENIALTAELQIAAMRDFLTGLYNRNYFEAQIEQIVSQCRRKKSSYAITFLDIDHFKVVNDTYGHDIGDIVLQEVAKVLQKTARGSDTLCRWGGEEFMIISADSDLLGASYLAERIRSNIERLVIHHDSLNNELKVTISAGVATGDSEDYNSIMKIADNRLYEAKDSGRNAVVIG